MLYTVYMATGLLSRLFLILAILITGVASYAQTYQLCIHSRYTKNVPGEFKTGHASLSILKNGKTIQKWGLWRDGVQSNYKYDGVLTKKIIKEFETAMTTENTKVKPKLMQSHHCKPIQKADIERIRTLATGYTKRYGEWSQIANNCTVFADRIYSQVTNDDFVKFNDRMPRSLYSKIEKGNERDAEAKGKPKKRPQVRQQSDVAQNLR